MSILSEFEGKCLEKVYRKDYLLKESENTND